MGRKKKESPGALSPEMRERVLMTLARKAAEGNIQAARIFLDEYRAQHGNTADKEQLAEAYKILDSISQEVGAAF